MTKTSRTESPPDSGRLKRKARITLKSSSIVLTSEEENEEQGILESFSKLPRTERELIRQLLAKFDTQRVGVIRFPIPFGREQVKERRQFLLPIYRLIRYHRLNFDSVVDGAIRSTYLPWIESITTIKAGKREELELRLNGNYEKIWRKIGRAHV